MTVTLLRNAQAAGGGGVSAPRCHLRRWEREQAQEPESELVITVITPCVFPSEPLLNSSRHPSSNPPREMHPDPSLLARKRLRLRESERRPQWPQRPRGLSCELLRKPEPAWREPEVSPLISRIGLGTMTVFGGRSEVRGAHRDTSRSGPVVSTLVRAGTG